MLVGGAGVGGGTFGANLPGVPDTQAAVVSLDENPCVSYRLSELLSTNISN